jgi:hypothetical protein
MLDGRDVLIAGVAEAILVLVLPPVSGTLWDSFAPLVRGVVGTAVREKRNDAD